jgi:hypothetical protein
MSSSGNEMVLKCDLHEALIDPMTLLSGEYFVSIACIVNEKIPRPSSW